MDFSNVHFSEVERKQLIENKQKVIDYIMNEIIPLMRDGESIGYDFGGVYSAWGCRNSTTNYHIKIYKEEHTFYPDYGKSKKGHIGFSQKYGGYECFDDMESPYAIAPVLYDWNSLKKVLLGVVKDRNKDVISVCSNFVL